MDSGLHDTSPRRLTPKEKNELVVETAGIADEHLGEVLRERGLHTEHFTIRDQELRDMTGKQSNRQQAEHRALKKLVRELERELHRKEKALAEAAALLVLKKTRDSFHGPRGRLILEAHKKDVMTWIEQAHSDGARYSKACEVVGISLRTLQR